MFVSKKVKKGITYYYLTQTGRVKGKVRITMQMYLGTAERLKKVFENGLTLNIKSKVFGSVAAMLATAEELGLKDIISNAVPDANYKLKIWQHVLLQSICRFHEPSSKKQSIAWYDDSILPLLWGKTFSSPQTICNQFDKLAKANANNLQAIEEGVCKALIEKGIQPSVLVWDPTNFYTYIEKGESLPAKGASKEKRFDKNIVNLGLVVSKEGIPFMHTTYEGNGRETKIVTEVVDGLFARLTKLGQDTDNIVFVFDRGNNSKDTIPRISETFHFVGALRKTQLKKLYDVGLEQFTDLYATKSKRIIKGYRTTETVYGEKYTIVVAYSEKTAKRQKLKTDEAVKKIREKFEALEKRLNRPKKNGKKASLKGVTNKVHDFLFKQFRSLFSFEFDEKNAKFTWAFNENALAEREKTYGKTVLFTDLSDWTSEQIAKTYNSKVVVENDFKALKNKLVIPMKPFFHRMDSRLRVHVFICVLSMVLYRFLLWKLQKFGLCDQQVINDLKGMRLAFVKASDSNSVRKVIENMTPEQLSLSVNLQLDRFLPK